MTPDFTTKLRFHDSNPKCEWAEPRVLQVQFRNVNGHGVDQFKDPRTQVVVAPRDWASGELIYPYAKAR